MSCSAEMGCDRDRALLEFRQLRGAGELELLGLAMEDIDWGGQLIYVVSKGTRVRQPVPASPDAFRYLGRYLAADGLPSPGQPVWRTRRGGQRPMTYWAMRRVLQRANERLGTNWSLHNARHTAAARLAGDERLTLAEVQTIIRHAHLDTTGHYLTARIEDLHDKLHEHYTEPRPQRSYPARLTRTTSRRCSVDEPGTMHCAISDQATRFVRPTQRACEACPRPGRTHRAATSPAPGGSYHRGDPAVVRDVWPGGPDRSGGEPVARGCCWNTWPYFPGRAWQQR